ncbi:MAG: DUF1572 family protein [Gemmatimonadaceae bacterium]
MTTRPASFDLADRFIARSRYYLGVEYPAKIRLALLAMPADRIWWRPHEASNSVGNLILHLAGNVRQWIVAGVGEASDTRLRDAEFSTRGGDDAAHLLERLEKALSEVDAVLARITPESLGERRMIQGRETSIFSAIYHVVEHFSGHTGQIIMLAKEVAPGAVRFYDDTGGLARPTFLGDGRSDVE